MYVQLLDEHAELATVKSRV